MVPAPAYHTTLTRGWNSDMTATIPRFPFLGAALLALLTIGATLIGFADLMSNGPFTWHIRQPQFVQGGLELLVLAAGVVLAERLRDRRVGFAVLFTLVALYARRHFFDYALLLTTLYVLGLYSLGLLAGRLIGLKQDDDRQYSLIKHFLLGVVAYTIVIWTSGLVFQANFQQPKIIAAVLLGASILLSRPFRTLSLRTAGTSWGLLFPSVARAVLIATLLAILAKGSYAIGYDALWYGLRPDRILFGPGGLYQDLDLSTWVYYYPKLYEVLISPLVGNGPMAGALAFSAFSWVFMLTCLDWTAKQFTIPRDWRWALLLALGTIPAAAAIGVTTKGELFAAGLLLLCMGSLKRSHKDIGLSPLMDCAGYALLASTVRLSMIPYLAIIFVVFCIALIRWYPQRNDPRATKVHRGEVWMLVSVVIAVVLVHYRTYLITGYPLIGTSGMTDVFHRLGFQPKFPNVVLPDSAGRVLLPFDDLLLRYLFHPSRLNRLTWTGNLWASLLLASLLAVLIRRNFNAVGKVAIPLGMGAAFFVILATVRFPIPGGDGNYFLVPIAALLLAASGILASSGEDRWRCLPWALLATSLLQFAMFFMSSGWYTGTRKFDTNFTISPLDEARRTRTLLGYQRLLPVADAIASCGHGERVIGLVSDPTAYLLPGRYESVEELAWSNRMLLRSPTAFAAYLQRARIELVVIPAQDATPAAISKTFGLSYRPIPDLMRSGIRLLVAHGQPVTMSRLGDYELYHIVTGYGSGACRLR